MNNQKWKCLGQWMSEMTTAGARDTLEKQQHLGIRWRVFSKWDFSIRFNNNKELISELWTSQDALFAETDEHAGNVARNEERFATGRHYYNGFLASHLLSRADPCYFNTQKRPRQRRQHEPFKHDILELMQASLDHIFATSRPFL